MANVVTVFLVELIVALLIGHAALSVSKGLRRHRTKQTTLLEAAGEARKAAEAGPGNGRYVIGGNGNRLEHQLLLLKASQRALNEKMDMLRSRLEEVEGTRGGAMQGKAAFQPIISDATP